MDTLHNIFIELASKYSNDKALIQQLWDEIETRHGEPHRHYHNLEHLESLLEVLSPLKNEIDDWDALLFGIFYHDIIYDPAKRDNEEQSAVLAVERLKELRVPQNQIEFVQSLIIATQSHENTTSHDIQLFLDADLSILGHCETVYINYSHTIRAEYSMYPDELYLPGRLKVLDHFLAMPSIFKTTSFIEKYETLARENLTREKEKLSNQLA